MIEHDSSGSIVFDRFPSDDRVKSGNSTQRARDGSIFCNRCAAARLAGNIFPGQFTWQRTGIPRNSDWKGSENNNDIVNVERAESSLRDEAGRRGIATCGVRIVR